MDALLSRALCTPRLALCALSCALLPSPVLRIVLRAMGHHIGSGVKVGLSLIWCKRLHLDKGARIGHLNLIRVDRLLLRRDASIGRLNIFHGPFSVVLRSRAAVGNSNKVLRAPLGSVTTGPSLLRLGHLTKITAGHRVDATTPSLRELTAKSGRTAMSMKPKGLAATVSMGACA
jgi:hypothetical protein